MKILQRLMAIGVVLLAASPVLAQAPQGTPTRLRGTVDSLSGDMLMITDRSGQMQHITLAPNYTVRSMVVKQLSDIKASDYVAVTSMRGADKRLHAVEVRIFPEAMRGTGEGQFPWDLMPESIMTNATVERVTTAPKGRTLKVNFKGKEDEIDVGPECPIMTYGPGDASLLKKGAAVFIGALKKPDGSFSTASVTAEKDGVKPPM
jgi:hypothetical protein